MAEHYFRTELDALLFSVTEGVPMDVRYAVDGYWGAICREDKQEESRG